MPGEIILLSRLEPREHAILVGLRGLDARLRLLHERIQHVHELGKRSRVHGSISVAIEVLDDLPDLMREALAERRAPSGVSPYCTSSKAEPNTSFTSSGRAARLLRLLPTHLSGFLDGAVFAGTRT